MRWRKLRPFLLALSAVLTLSFGSKFTPAVKADYPIIGFDSLMYQKASGNERFGAMGSAIRVDSGGASVPGILLNNGFDSLEIDARLIDQPGHEFDLTTFGAMGGYFWRPTTAGGSPFGANFDPSQYQLEVTFKPGANNAATRFDISIDQHDGFNGSSQSQGEQFRWRFTDFVTRYNDAVTLGQADAEGFVTLTRDITQLPNPVTGNETQSWDERGATATGFAAPGDNLLDLDAIENGARNGVTRLQFRSVFGSTDRFNVILKSVKFVPKTSVPEVARLDAKSSFTSNFGSAQTAGAFNRDGENMVLDFNGSGGVSLNQVVTSFDGTQYGVEVTAKLLGNNTAPAFRVVAKDLDGNDNAPNTGAEEWALLFDTNDFNASGFSTVTLPWSDAALAVTTAFGFTNSGDGSLDDFDLFQLQVAANAGSRLNIEIASIKVVPFEAGGLDGDFDGDGDVDGRDFLLWQRNPSIGDLADWQDNYGLGTSVATATIPEPSAICLVLLSGIGILGCHRPRHSKG